MQHAAFIKPARKVTSSYHHMLSRALTCPIRISFRHTLQMNRHISNGATTDGGVYDGKYTGTTLQNLAKSNVFTKSLPPDPEYKTPMASHQAPRQKLGPRMVKGALYTFVRPEEAKDPELLAVSKAAMKDIGLQDGADKTEDFQALVTGNKIFWDEKSEEGIYPWAQCYGGWQFGSWAGQLGDGRAISLFESTNPATKVRYEMQLKGAGRTPYSRFADGKAVLRSSIREFVVSEALNGLHIPTTRALSLTWLPTTEVLREKFETGAIVARFAQSWLRIGTFDILRARGDRDLVRRLADYVAENVYQGWTFLPAALDLSKPLSESVIEPQRSVSATENQGEQGSEENRYTRLYREICRRNALTVAAWQAYAFTNGVLNTDNTSLLGLSLDFGPFAFLDNFDPNYTPNHDDHMLRYSYKNQPSIIWWNLVRLGETLAELIGAGTKVDDKGFVESGLSETTAPEVIKRAETLIQNAGEEYKALFLAEYSRLMRLRLGLTSVKEQDFDQIFSELLDALEELELDFTHFFRRLSSVKVSELQNGESREKIAGRFFHAEGMKSNPGHDESQGRERLAKWLETWATRVKEDWGSDGDVEREQRMKEVNPKFIPRSWILDEVIRRVEKDKDRDVLDRIMNMAENPFAEGWGGDETEEERWCGDVPRAGRGMQCSCSS